MQTNDEQTTNTTDLQLDSDYLRSLDIHFGLITNGNVTDRSFMSFIKFSNVARQADLKWSVQTINQAIDSRLARNALISAFLQQSDKTHLALIDYDIEWEPWHLLVMANHKVDVISGLYSQTSLPLRWVVDPVDNSASLQDLTQVKRINSGFLLLSRDALLRLENHPETVSCGTDLRLEDDQSKNINTHFSSAVIDGKFYDDDANFSRKWSECDGKIWVDTRVLLSRTGTFHFSVEEQDRLSAALRSNVESNTQ